MAASMVADEMSQVYENIADLIGAQASEIALVESATVASTRLFYSFVEASVKRNIILVSQVEYAATVVAAVRYASMKENWEVHMIPSHLGTGKVDLERFSSIIEGRESIDPDRIALVCVTHIPTNSGIVNPVEEIGESIQAYNKNRNENNRMFYLCDACQSVGHIPVDVRNIKCDGLVGTGRKYLRGPRGTGFLFISEKCNVWPAHVDHNSVPVVDIPSRAIESGDITENLRIEPKLGGARFEFWESNASTRLGLGLAVRQAKVKERESAHCITISLARHLYKLLSQIDRIHTFYPPDCGIVTFHVEGMEAKQVLEMMWQNGRVRFELSVVAATSTPLDSALTGTSDLVRASLSYTNTFEEIECFAREIQLIL